MAEGEGFEPPVPLRVRLISSQVPSTTQPPFRDSDSFGPIGLRIWESSGSTEVARAIQDPNPTGFPPPPASAKARPAKRGRKNPAIRPAPPPYPAPRSTLHAPRAAHPGPHTMLCAAVPGPNNGFLAMLCRGTGSSCSGGGSGRLGIPGLGSAGPDLRSQGSSDKERLSRCARGKVLIASSARSGRVPLPSVVREVKHPLPIIAGDAPATVATMNLIPPRPREWMKAFHQTRIPTSEIVP